MPSSVSSENHQVPVYNKCTNSQLTYLKDVIADVIYMNNGWVSITDLGAQHCPELGWPSHQYYLMSVKDSPLHPKLHITQLWVVDKFWINPGASREWSVLDALDWFPAKTSWEDVCKEQRSSLILEDQEMPVSWFEKLSEVSTISRMSRCK